MNWKFWEQKPRENKKATWWDGAGGMVVAVGVALMIRWALLEAYVIPSGSMLPSLLINDHIFVNKMVYGVRVPFSKQWMFRFGEPQRGEIIVFRWPEDESIFFIKRVVGVPGDQLEYRNGELFINGEKIPRTEKNDPEVDAIIEESPNEPLASDVQHYIESLKGVEHSVLLRKDGMHTDGGPVTIPEGSLYVMGDNRNNSRDSRFFGFVPIDNLLGRASFVWLSCQQSLPVINMFCNPLTIRWKRFFHSVH